MTNKIKVKEVTPIYPRDGFCSSPVVIDTKKVLLLTMTSGGGMGGARWTELVDYEENIPSNQLYKFRDAITGEDNTLNTSNIVKAVPKQMLRTYDDATSNKKASNKAINKAWYERIIVLGENEKWECVPKWCAEVTPSHTELYYEK